MVLQVPKGQQAEAAVTFTPFGQFPHEERSEQQLQLWRCASIQNESLCSLGVVTLRLESEDQIQKGAEVGNQIP